MGTRTQSTVAIQVLDNPCEALGRAVATAVAFASAAKSDRTRELYAGAWAAFVDWAEASGAKPLPAQPEMVAAYIGHLAELGRKPSTIELALSAIAQAHKAANLPSPRGSLSVAATRAGMRRSLGVAQRQVAPLSVDNLRAMLATLPPTLAGSRDRALLLVGFAGALRRSELVGLDVADLRFVQEGLEVTIRRSKTDQEGQGRSVELPFGSNLETCPVRAVKVWLEASGITAGPLFRPIGKASRLRPGRLTANSVAVMIKRTTAAVGLDASQFSGHSLRAGFATQAAKAGQGSRQIMRQTGHTSEAMVNRYVRLASRWENHPAAKLGL